MDIFADLRYYPDLYLVQAAAYQTEKEALQLEGYYTQLGFNPTIWFSLKLIYVTVDTFHILNLKSILILKF